MANDITGTFDGRLVNAQVSIGGQKFKDITAAEIILGESLLTPGLQTAVTLQSYIYGDTGDPIKDFGAYKNKDLTINMQTKDGSQYLDLTQKIYRIDNREMLLNIGQTESFTVHACDQSLLNDAKTVVSKSWKCTRPSDVVSYVLQSCAGVSETALVVDSAGPARDYIAENIHPFQVVTQQCNAALYNDNDPSFLHYMTFDGPSGGGMHYFRALGKLMQGGPVQTFYYSEGRPEDVTNPNRAINFSFPCDFDLLSDLLNGVDENGNNINTLSVMNLLSGQAQLLGASTSGYNTCGVGGGNAKQAITNKGTSQQQNGCDLGVEQYLLLRQARMGLLEKDKIAFRITVPWNPARHVGDVIRFEWLNKVNGGLVYGSGNYLVAALTHNLQFGGYATTTLDCIRRQY